MTELKGFGLGMSLGVVNHQQKKERKPERHRLPRGEAKSKILHVRFTADRFGAVESAARASSQTVSEWVRSTLDAALGDGRPVTTLPKGV